MVGLKSKISAWVRQFEEDPYAKWVLLVIMVGAVLRYYGLHNAENGDEYNEVFEALRVASGKFNTLRWHKKGYQNLLAVEYGVYFIIGYLLHIFQNPIDFAAKMVRNLDSLLLIGRYTTATLGTSSIGLIYLIGRKVFSPRAGLIAAILLAFNPTHVVFSHYVNTDVPMLFFFLLSLYFVVRISYIGNKTDYILAAFSAAVSVNIKVMGGGALIILLLTHLLRCKKEGRLLVGCLYSKEIVWSLGAFIVGYVATNPAIIFGFKNWVMSFVWNYEVYKNVNDYVPNIGGGKNAYDIYILALAKYEFGLWLFLLTVGGLLWALYKRERWDYAFLGFLLVIFLALANAKYYIEVRYLLVAFPVLFLLNGRFLDSWGKGRQQWRLKMDFVVVIVLLLAVSLGVGKSLRFVISLTEENTSVTSKRWIEANIPSGSKILIDAGRTIISSGPRLNESKENLERKLELIKGLKPGETYDSPLVRIVDSYSAIYYEMLLKDIPEVTYDLVTTENGKQVETAEYYKGNGFDYFIRNGGGIYMQNDEIWRKKYPKSAQFYDEVDTHFVLMKMFEPTATKSGPIIKVYKVR